MSIQPCATKKFPLMEEIPTVAIHARLQHGYGDTHMGHSNVYQSVKNCKIRNTQIAEKHVVVTCKLPILRETMETSMSSSERTNMWQGNGSTDQDRAPCSPRDGGKFGIPESLCPIGSLLSDGEARTSAKKCFLTSAGTSRQVTKDGFITLIQKQSDRTWNCITQHHSRRRRRKEKTQKTKNKSPSQ